jgi:hypothetical protein
MKELSIEEKAKAYDEALKVLHKYDGANIMFSQSLKEEMFPELKKSEDPDEKVRKALIKLVTNHASMDLFIEYDIHSYEALDWLEKQGETSPVLSNSSNTGKIEQKPAWSEEDETGLTNTIIMLKEGASLHFNKNDITKAVDWIKSIKERVHPKC